MAEALSTISDFFQHLLQAEYTVWEILSFLIFIYLSTTLFIFTFKGRRGVPGISEVFIRLGYFLGIRAKSNRLFEYQKRINKITRNIYSPFFNKTIKIDWLSKRDLQDSLPIYNGSIEDRESDKIKVYVDSDNSTETVVVDAIEEYVDDMLPNIRHSISQRFRKENVAYLSGLIMNGIREKRIQKEYENRYRQFIYSPDYLDKISSLDENNLYFSVFLDASLEACNLKVTSPFDEKAAREMIEFFEFIYKVYKSDQDEDVPLEYNEDVFNYSIILVAKEETVERAGLEAHISQIKDELSSNIRRIYIAGIGSVNKTNARKICHYFSTYPSAKILSQDVSESSNIGKEVYIASIQNKNIVSSDTNPDEEVLHAIEDVVPAVQEGRVHVAGVAREVGYGSKVAIDSTEEDESAYAACVGRNGVYARKVRRKFEDEYLSYIPLDEDLNEIVSNSLNTDEFNIEEKEMGENTNKVVVSVDSDYVGHARKEAALSERATDYKFRIVSK